MVTAVREPLTHTVIRALHAAVCRSFGGIPSASSFPAAPSLEHALEDASSDDLRRRGPSPAALVEIARCLADDGPLLLVIDEFGKNLEAVASGSGHGAASDESTDPYLLQQLAESGQGDGLPIFLLTLQHQSLDDYLSGVDASRRREWAKVQGRFEDIAYVESSAQTRALIGSVFQVGDERLRHRIDRWSRPLAQTMQSLGVADLADPAAVASCWPLHPMTAVVLSELCQRYGQHERTLFSFLAGPEMAGSNGFLATTRLPERGTLPTLGLDSVYDYFVGASGLSSMVAAANSRWLEIATRLRDVHGLSVRQERVAKAVAVLNLVSTSGTIRASDHVLSLVESGAKDVLDQLAEAGLVTHREFADEYRIWQGTDVDIQRLVEDSRVRIQQQSLLEIMSKVDDPQPVVAARHSAVNDCLRVFSRRYSDSTGKAEPLDAFSPFDGEVLLLVDGDQPPPLVGAPLDGAKPTVAAIARPDDLAGLEAAACELGALTDVLDNPEVELDWVARHELDERLALARTEFDRAVFAAYATESCQWILLDGDEGMALRSGRGSSALSEVADSAYPSSPIVRNEMLNRTHLTSQGAKARRLLIEAMIERGDQADLGLEGYGPEVAMYKAALAHTRLHTKCKTTGKMQFRAPDRGAAARSLLPAWKALKREFQRARQRRVSLNDVNAVLRSPPVGMKAGVVPVLVTAGLLVYTDEIALYEHGTFKPRLTVDMAERMVRNPGFFEIKHFASAKGARRQALDALAGHLEVQMKADPDRRVASVLSVVGNLVGRARRLDSFTQRTRSLSPETAAVRDALLAAVEPDELLFASLPEALGLPEIAIRDDSYPDTDAFAAAVVEAMDELEAVDGKLLSDSLALLLSCAGSADRQAVVERAASVEADALDPAIRPFVLALTNDGVDDDAAWIRTIATVVAQKAPAEWTDEDVRRFRLVLPEQMATFERLVALYSDPELPGTGGRQASSVEHDGGDGPESVGSVSALRVTVTRSDGREHARLVKFDPGLREGLTAALDQAIADIEELTGPGEQARHALLALLGERVLEDPDHE